jgi:hypothetical protein
LLLLSPTPSTAAIIVYSGADPGVGSGGARPNSDAAQTAFAAGAGGPLTTLTFEGLSLGDFSSMNVGGGVTATLTGTSSDANAGITNAVATDLGYNTTSGGANHLRFVPSFNGASAQLAFSFSNPIQSFGFYLTGAESSVDGTFTLQFTDGSSQSLPITKGSVSGGGVQFFGFSDVGTSITSVTFNSAGPFSTRDIVGFDDVQFAPTAATPEPATLAVFGALAAGAFGLRRRVKATA